MYFKIQVVDKDLEQENCIKLLGVFIDNKLNFHKHIANLCCKISRQISVFNRFKRMIPYNAKIKSYNSFILWLLNCCSTVWNFSLKSDSEKLEKLKETALRSAAFQDKTSDYDKTNKTTLKNRRL